MSKLLDVVMSNLNPIILVFSGKRKTGKDYIVCEIVKRSFYIFCNYENQFNV